MDGADASAWHEALAQQNFSNPEVDGAEQRNGENAPFMLAFNFQMDLRYAYGM